MYTEYKKGFVSSFFLLLLISVSSICLALIFKVECEIRAIENMKEVNHRFENEIEIIGFIKCKLNNNNLVTGIYSTENHDLRINYTENIIECEDNNGDIIYIYLNNGKIVDYLYKKKE